MLNIKHIFYVIILSICTMANANGQIEFSELHFSSAFEKQQFTLLNNGEYADPLALLLVIDPTVNNDKYIEIKKHLLEFNRNKKLYKNPKRAFYLTQQKHLSYFKEYTDFSNIFETNDFNCVSGTGLIAYIYSINNFEFSINEIPHHVYLTVKHHNKKYLAESTDPNFGFRKINKKTLNRYKEDSLDNSLLFSQMKGYNAIPNNGFKVNSEVDLLKLAGLQYYNAAIVKLNQGDYLNASFMLEKAFYLYQSERIMTVLKYSLIMTARNQAQPKIVRQESLKKFAKYQPTYFWITSTK